MSDDLEAIVLSNLLKSEGIREKYLSRCAPTDFGSKSHIKIYHTLIRLAQSAGNITKDIVQEALAGDVVVQMNATFLFDYGDELTPEIFEKFKQGGQKIRLVAIKDHINRELLKGTDINIVSDQVRTMLIEVEAADSLIEVSNPEQSVEATQWVLDKWARGEMPVISGLPELDAKLFLSQFIGYWIIAANSGVGKSSLMINIARNNARMGIPSTVCSLEMSRELLYIRMAMEDPRVAGLELTEQTVRNAQKMSDLKYAVDQLKKLPLYVVQGVSNIFRLDKISRRNAIDKGCKLTLFDYIQLGKTHPSDSDVVRVSGVSRTLQGLTVPDLPNGYHGQAVIALSQYNGEGSKLNTQFTQDTGRDKARGSRTAGRRAGNDDLAWSSQIRQDADGILHMYATGTDRDVVDVEIFCGKQRSYKSDWHVNTQFITSEQRFETALSRKQRALGIREPKRQLNLE